MARELLTKEALAEAVAGLDGWTVRDGKLHKEYVFSDFVEAFGFVAAAEVCGDGISDRREWCNVYQTVCVVLSMHDLGGISTWDVKLAGEFDAVAGRG